MGKFSGVLLASDFAADITELLSGVSNIHVMTNATAVEEIYYSEHFRTDHHWNSSGALRAFNEIADTVGIQKPNNLKQIDFEGEAFVGALARWGLFCSTSPFMP